MHIPYLISYIWFRYSFRSPRCRSGIRARTSAQGGSPSLLLSPRQWRIGEILWPTQVYQTQTQPWTGRTEKDTSAQSQSCWNNDWKVEWIGVMNHHTYNTHIWKMQAIYCRGKCTACNIWWAGIRFEHVQILNTLNCTEQWNVVDLNTKYAEGWQNVPHRFPI